MKLLLRLRGRFVSFYKKHIFVVGYFLRLVFVLIVLLLFRPRMEYNELLSQTWFVLAFSVVSAFIPTRFLPLTVIAYISFQIMSLSTGIGAAVLIVLIVMYLLYFRINPDYALLIILLPAFTMIRLPLLAVLVLALTTPFNSIFAVLAGHITYYLIHYVDINAAVFSGIIDSLESEVTELNMLGIMVYGFFTYKEFLYSTFTVLAVFVITYYVKKIYINRSNDMAAVIGTGTYIIFMIAFNLAFNTITVVRLATIVVGSIVSLILALLAENIALPLDYSRTEFLEFEDEEYYYYVRAVPKTNLDREVVSVKQINRRVKKEEKGET